MAAGFPETAKVSLPDSGEAANPAGSSTGATSVPPTPDGLNSTEAVELSVVIRAGLPMIVPAAGLELLTSICKGPIPGRRLGAELKELGSITSSDTAIGVLGD